MPIMREQEGDSNDVEFNYNRAIGPFYSSKGILRRLKIDEQALGEMVRTGKVLGLPTAEGELLYPTRQFIANEDGVMMVNPAVEAAFRSIVESRDKSAVLLLLQVDSPGGLMWTIAGALLQQNEEGEILLHTLQQHLDNPKHESWERLKDMNGIVSKLRKVLPE